MKCWVWYLRTRNEKSSLIFFAYLKIGQPEFDGSTLFQKSFLSLQPFLMASLSKKSKSARSSPYNLPLTRVRNQEKGESFVEEHHDILNDYNVWWEPGHDIHANLLPSSDPCHPCTRVYPWFLDLGFHFPFSAFLKGILLYYNIAIYNLSLATFRLLTCFELMD